MALGFMPTLFEFLIDQKCCIPTCFMFVTKCSFIYLLIEKSSFFCFHRFRVLIKSFALSFAVLIPQ